MAAMVIIVVYVVIGCGAAVAIVIQRQPIGSLSVLATALLMAVLWPFLLPASLLAESSTPVLRQAGRSGPSERRIAELAARARSVFGDAGAPLREQAAIDAFVERLRTCDRRLLEMDRALEEAPPSVTAKLKQLRLATQKELEDGLGVLEELVGQLLVLRFTDLHRPAMSGSEREHVEALLVRIEALAADLSDTAIIGPA